MIRLKSRHGGDQRGSDSAVGTPAEPVQTAIIDDDTAEDAAIEDETAADVTAEADADVSEIGTEPDASDDRPASHPVAAVARLRTAARPGCAARVSCGLPEMAGHLAPGRHSCPRGIRAGGH